MALGLLYYSFFDSFNPKVAYKIEIYKEGFVGSSEEIIYNDVQACHIKYSGKLEALNDVVFGSDLVHRFYVTPDDADKYDTLFETTYRDVVVKYYEDAVLKWVGYLKPESLQREMLESNYLIQLSASDGIADLKNEEYANSGVAYKDRVSALTVMLRCLNMRGLDVALPFRIQLNTYETDLGAATDCALEDTTINSRRFTKTKDGITTNESCYHVLNEILRPFNVILRQSDGYIWIRQRHELNSYVYAYDSDGDYVSRTASNLIKNIDDFKFLPKSNQLQKYRPYHQSLVTFQNRNLGENIFTNGDFEDNDLSEWTAGSDIDSMAWDSGQLKALINVPNGFGNIGGTETNGYIISDEFALTKVEDGDRVKVSFRIKPKDVIYKVPPSTDGIRINVTVSMSSGFNVINQSIYLYTNNLEYQTYEFYGEMISTDDYKVRLRMTPNGALDWPDYSSMGFCLDDVFLNVEYEAGGDITFDKLITTTNEEPVGKTQIEPTLYFGDSFQANDVGALKIDDTLTERWRLYGETNDVPLLELYGLQLLRDRAGWKNILNVSIFDVDNELKAHHVLQFEGREYDFYNIEKDCVRKIWKVNLIELLTDDIDFNVMTQIKTSIDGVSSGSSSSVAVLPPGIYEPAFAKNTAFNKNFGTGNTQVARGDHTHEGLGDSNIEGGNSASVYLAEQNYEGGDSN